MRGMLKVYRFYFYTIALLFCCLMLKPALHFGASHSDESYYIEIGQPLWDTAKDTVYPTILGKTLDYGIDTSVSPCDDFYEYANGGWRKQVVFPQSMKPTVRSWSHFNDSPKRTAQLVAHIIDSAHRFLSTENDPEFRAIGTFYESCLAIDSLETVPRLRRPNRDSTKKDSTRKEQCVSRTKQHLGGALGQIFAGILEKNGSVHKMKNLLAALKEAADDRLRKHSLLSPDEISHARNRIENLYLRVGIPDVKIDYSKLILLPNEYNKNKDAIANFNTMSAVGSIGNDTREGWIMGLFTTNALYSPHQHAIEIPTVMFRSPFFDVAADDALNFAGVGYVIGHEVFHGLTTILNLSSNPDIKAELDSFKAINSRRGVVDGWRTDGKHTYGEDIADLGGTRIAYDAWKKMHASDPNRKSEIIDGFTPEQRFFLGVARVWRAKWTPESASNGNVHAAYFARVNGSVMQMPEFAEAFGCKEGDKMVLPREKVSNLW